MLLATVVLAAATIATIDGEPVTLDALDAPVQAEVERLREGLRTTVLSTLERLVDEALAAASPPPPTLPPAPIGDDEVRRFRASHLADFENPPRAPAVEDAAIRHFLAEQARVTARADTLRRLRAGRTVALAVPEGRLLEQPLPGRRKLARVDATAIRADAVERAAALPLYRARGELYLARKRRLDTLIDERLLAREAVRRGLPDVAALLPGAPVAQAVSDAELDAYVDAERHAGRVVADPERLRPYLAFRKSHGAREALLAELRSHARVEILLAAPAVPRLPQEEAGAPALGPADGRRLIAYSNYRCEPCRAVHREIDRLRADDPGVRVVLRDFIPVYDPVASEAARLARCAATLGAFEPMRRLLLDRPPPKFGQRWFEDAALPALAHTLHVDPAAFTGCLASLAVSDAIARDGAHARTLGFTEAPAFLADGIPLSGMQSAASLSRALRSPAPRLTPRAAAG